MRSTRRKLIRIAPSAKLISEGGNGSVYKIAFGDGQTGILKIPKGISKDNLMYEYMAGIKLNELRHVFPQFIETKHVYHFNESLGTPPNLNRLLDLSPHDPAHGCMTAGHQALLIKEVSGPSLKSKLTDAEFVKNDLAGVLYQIYYTLDALKHEFTHFDLHARNVLLDNRANGRPMLFRYPGVEFVCRYVPKIIDYGRAFVKGVDLSGLNSPSCNTPECAPNGKHCGFTYYHHEFQDITKPNVSQDLRLLVNLPGPFSSLSRMVRFGYHVPDRKKKFTTEEQFVGQWPRGIVNVTDALAAIKQKLPVNIGSYAAIFTIDPGPNLNKEYIFKLSGTGGTRRKRKKKSNKTYSKHT